MVDGPHKYETFHNHYDYDAYIFSKSEKQAAEVFGISSGSMMAVKPRHLNKATDKARHVIAPFLPQRIRQSGLRICKARRGARQQPCCGRG